MGDKVVEEIPGTHTKGVISTDIGDTSNSTKNIDKDMTDKQNNIMNNVSEKPLTENEEIDKVLKTLSKDVLDNLQFPKTLNIKRFKGVEFYDG